MPDQPSGTVVVTATPAEEAAAEVPAVTLRFEDPADRELYEVLRKVCHDLEYDIISLLHLACRGDLSGKATARPTTQKALRSKI